MIRLERVSRVYRLGDVDVPALREVTEEIQRGEHVAIMGPSGSGKSTLLHLVGLLDRPTSGSYFLEGREVADLDEAERSRVRAEQIGFVFQSYHLVARLSALGNVELPMMFAGVPRRERRRRALAALEAVGLAPRARHRPSQLSGGERQRTAIARATVMGPSLILADEPTGNLDTVAGGQVLDLLDRMHEGGITLLVVTHDPAVARRAQRVLILVDGRIARRLPAAELRDLAGALRGEEAGP